MTKNDLRVVVDVNVLVSALIVKTSTPRRSLKAAADCRDAKDNKYLELAVNGSATHIITGDADLLVMNPFRGIAIVAPQEFLESIKESQP